MPTAPSILIYGHDTTLLDTRRWLLERSGYRVETVMESAMAAEIMTARAIDLLLLCHTLNSAERREAADAAATIRPAVKRLSFVTIPEGTCGESEETVTSFAGAAGLIAAVQKILRRDHSN